MYLERGDEVEACDRRFVNAGASPVPYLSVLVFHLVLLPSEGAAGQIKTVSLVYIQYNGPVECALSRPLKAGRMVLIYLGEGAEFAWDCGVADDEVNEDLWSGNPNGDRWYRKWNCSFQSSINR